MRETERADPKKCSCPTGTSANQDMRDATHQDIRLRNRIFGRWDMRVYEMGQGECECVRGGARGPEEVQLAHWEVCGKVQCVIDR